MTDCPWDLNGDGVVDDADQIWLMDHWGPCVPGSKGDFNGDGTIDISDIVILQEHYGPCPGVTPPPSEITCNGTTPHFSSGCELLKTYDANNDGIIEVSERQVADMDGSRGVITAEESKFVTDAYLAGSINTVCPGCYNGIPTPVCTPGEKRCFSSTIKEVCKTDGSGWIRSSCNDGYECKNGECVLIPTPSPDTETRTMSLTEGQHTIQVSFTGYDTLNATINVSSTGVTCVSVIGGACGGSGLPRVSTSGWTVTTYLKTGTVTSSYATWLAGKGGLSNVTLPCIFELKDEFIGLTNKLGFTPTLPQIMECKDAFIGLI